MTLLLIIVGVLSPVALIAAMVGLVFYWAGIAISDEEMEFLENVRPERFTSDS